MTGTYSMHPNATEILRDLGITQGDVSLNEIPIQVNLGQAGSLMHGCAWAPKDNCLDYRCPST